MLPLEYSLVAFAGVEKDAVMTVARGMIALIGSGELADTMAETHRQLMTRVSGGINAVFVDTMAGFELNIDQIGQKAGAYFSRNFGLTLTIARFRQSEDSAETVASAVNAIRAANYIFAGPGSPTYGVRIWRDSRVWNAIVERWQAGAMLVFASAAAITLGVYTLPVYEIYKVGLPPHWVDGLNLFGALGMNAAIVPHWNNNSGDQHDTRFCYMGERRFNKLEALLPAEAEVVGIDEYTALVIDPVARTGDVYGVGNVTLRQNGHQRTFGKGQQFTIGSVVEGESITLTPYRRNSVEADTVAADSEVADLSAAATEAIGSGDLRTASDRLTALALVAETGLEQGLPGRTEAAVRALQTLLPDLAHVQTGAGDQSARDVTRLVDLLVMLRGELRTAKQWALADRVRDQLAALDYILSDTPTGTTWRKAEAVN